MKTDPILETINLTKRFGNGVLAVDNVSLTLYPGETLGLVGESGCGKSTTGKLILRLLSPDSGSVFFDGYDLGQVSPGRLRELRAKLQLVPQNPQTSLHPRLSVGQSITFNLRAHRWPRHRRAARVAELLDRVGLTAAHAERYPHELSGGQLQRVAIARALATDPSVVVCDEAVSALDKSVQAQVLNLLADLQREQGIAFLFISHDLGVVEHLSDRVCVMYLGRVVEETSARELWERPAHPYSEALISATPGRAGGRILLQGDLPNPTSPPSGCTFRTRCPVAFDACASERPPLDLIAPGRRAACLLAAQRLEQFSSPVG
jgi:peptide/nickel transport system ATP-binding protein/oligopeptide transport system ATP-binding protein